MSAEDLPLEDIVKKAKGYALRLFKLRPRSEAELKNKLRNKGYSADIALRLVEEFKHAGYLDDAAFAKAWMQSRLKKYGYRRVARELAEKGILKESVACLWETLRQDYDEESVARDIVARRERLYKDLPPLKRRRLLMDTLARRGFSMGMINKVTREI